MEFLTTKGIAANIERIIRNAKEFIAIITPYVRIDEQYICRLHDAERNGVKITLIFGKEDMQEFEKNKFRDFHNLEIFFLENLHAKCYFNENTAIITSMNLYDYSERNNREMGIEVNKSENYKIFDDILQEATSIKDAAEPYYLQNWNKQSFSNRRFNQGYCIHCRTQIAFDSYRPLCYECYQIWIQLGNMDYPENFCHKCGKKPFSEQLDYAHPLCNSCYYER